MKTIHFKNDNIGNDYDGLCDFNKNVDDCVGSMYVDIYIYTKKNLIRWCNRSIQ